MDNLSGSDKSESYEEMHLIKNQIRWKRINDPQIYDYPYNCIGWITINTPHQPITGGNGSLISRSLVLTSAHIFSITERGNFPLTSEITFHLMNKEVRK